MQMPEPKINILCTRPLPSSLVEEAAGKGIRIQVIPFIGTSPVPDEELNVQVQDLAGRALTVIFTSVNSVDAVSKWLKKEGGDPAQSKQGAVPAWRIFCIAGATRAEVENVFGKEVVAGAAHSARELARLIIRTDGPGPGKELFFFCGDLSRDELPSLLRENGFRVNERVVYRTTLTPRSAPDKYDGIVFFSPSAVHSFFSLNTVRPETILFTIGLTTMEAIHTYVPNTTIPGATPDKEQLIRQAIDYFQTDTIYTK
ncbi:MAG TPA: uroporphyrinogen-III synthase [Puia sp.]|jgi:uroporphyrinogen-III synthase|nr:uroporphyrinogen-III synthase [Puia sp.]